MHKNNGLSAASADHVSKLIRRFLTLAVEWGMLEKNSASRIQLFNEDNQIEHYLDDEQLQQLLKVLQTDANRSMPFRSASVMPMVGSHNVMPI